MVDIIPMCVFLRYTLSLKSCFLTLLKKLPNGERTDASEEHCTFDAWCAGRGGFELLRSLQYIHISEITYVAVRTHMHACVQRTHYM